ncbi:peptidoglycan recognition protein family protein [Candidatus Scalindua japonica]|uniref:peptidoglycan recognition protein family protein n=1 Tax=Candidatus Scalindua japonica TaxID=1284222 RepID=UPI000BDE8A14|nr:peptidoglycan recognition family protein [Candidatus Scalindua japonica]
MKIVERHVKIFIVAMFVTASGLLIYYPFISVKRKIRVTTIDLERLCEVDVSENNWQYVVIHHSATDEGCANSFDRYHREQKKWSHGLAYHFVIGNGNGSGNGVIEVGNRWKKQIHGAHTANKDLNQISIGICLVGNFEKDKGPTDNQFTSLISLINYFSKKYNIPISHIVKHCQVLQKGTACPGRHFPYRQLINKISSLQSL